MIKKCIARHCIVISLFLSPPLGACWEPPPGPSLRAAQGPERYQRFVLSVDGGGIRGVIPAVILRYLEKELKGATTDHFDVFGGTSTGGIIVGALNVPTRFTGGDPWLRATGVGNARFSADDLVQLYSKRGGEIFTQRTFGRFFGPRYDRRPLDNLLNRYFGDMSMTGSLKPLLLTSYDMARARPILMQSHFPQAQTAYTTRAALWEPILQHIIPTPPPLFRMRDALAATSAAPTYFAPVEIDRLNASAPYTPPYTMIDGGAASMNNPVLETAGYARELSPETPLENYTILSLGTGESSISHTRREMRHWTPLHWVKPVLSSLMDGSSMAADILAEQIFNGNSKGPHYYRLNKPLQWADPEMDNCSQENIANLKHEAYAILNTQEDTLRKLVEALKTQKEDFAPW